MEHITLIDCSDEIEAGHLIELYQSKLKYLTATLMYLDRIGVQATVSLLCEVRDKRLLTTILVETKDEVFRKILVEATKSFNSPTAFAGKTQVQGR
jgi:hypothetical protein